MVGRRQDLVRLPIFGYARLCPRQRLAQRGATSLCRGRLNEVAVQRELGILEKRRAGDAGEVRRSACPTAAFPADTAVIPNDATLEEPDDDVFVVEGEVLTGPTGNPAPPKASPADNGATRQEPVNVATNAEQAGAPQERKSAPPAAPPPETQRANAIADLAKELAAIKARNTEVYERTQQILMQRWPVMRGEDGKTFWRQRGPTAEILDYVRNHAHGRSYTPDGAPICDFCAVAMEPPLEEPEEDEEPA